MLFKIEVSIFPENESDSRNIERKMLGNGYSRVGYYEENGVFEFLFKGERDYPFEMNRGEESRVLALNIEKELALLLVGYLSKSAKVVVTAL